MSTHVCSSSHFRSNATSRSTCAASAASTRSGYRAPRVTRLRSVTRMGHNAVVEHAIVVEIPKGSRNKYEMDHDSSEIWLDRTLFTAMQYPADYGFFPDTLAEDGDPLDALVLLQEPTFPGCHIMVRAVAVFWMTDEMGPDAKVLCVPAHDPRWNDVNDLAGCPRPSPARDRALLRLLQDDRTREGRDHARLGRRVGRRRRHHRRQVAFSATIATVAVADCRQNRATGWCGRAGGGRCRRGTAPSRRRRAGGRGPR